MTALSIAAAARDYPDRDALIIDGTRYSFGQLAGPVSRTADWLVGNRIGSGPIAFIAHRSFDAMVLAYAALELGACIAPIHDRLSPPEIEAQRHRLSPSLWIPPDFHVPSTQEPRPPSDTRIHDSDPLAILFTSGSTGMAKGAVLSRRAFVTSAAASAENLGWKDDDRWLLSLSHAHVGGLSVIVRCLVARRCLVVDQRPQFDPIHTATLLRDHRVTLWSAVPAMVSSLLAATDGDTVSDHLRAVLLGGAAAGDRLLEACAEGGLPALTTYGMTETCAQVCTQGPGWIPAPDAGVGAPLSHAEIRIADDGAVEVRSAGLLDGYLPPHHEPAPVDAHGWYRTGDRGIIDARGRLRITGRIDDAILTGGECVDPLEVERVLETFPHIREACVFGVPDARWGELVAATLVATGALDRAALRAFLRARLAGFKHPRRIHLADALPVSAAGKRDRAAAVAHATPYLQPL